MVIAPKRYKFKLIDAQPKKVRHLMATAKIARKENTGFFIDYSSKYPILERATFEKSPKNGLFFKFSSSSLINDTFVKQLSEYLGTSFVSQYKSE